jgi:hypothetical protein
LIFVGSADIAGEVEEAEDGSIDLELLFAVRLHVFVEDG